MGEGKEHEAQKDARAFLEMGCYEGRWDVLVNGICLALDQLNAQLKPKPHYNPSKCTSTSRTGIRSC